MSTIAHALVSALYMAFAMGWEILWPLILGFALSGVVQAVLTKRRDEPTPARFLIPLDHDRDRARGRIVVLFLRGCSNRPIDFP